MVSVSLKEENCRNQQESNWITATRRGWNMALATDFYSYKQVMAYLYALLLISLSAQK